MVPLERYLATVYDNPRGPREGAIAYVARIADLAAKLHGAATPIQAPVKGWSSVPEVRLPYSDGPEERDGLQLDVDR